MNEHKIPIPSMIYNAAVGGHVTNSKQIIDENLNREQQDINEEVAAVPYNASNPNGMGKIVLKKNDNFKQVVEEQTNGNTIFVIKYKFTLTNNVTIPANCVLEFDGGSINGGQNNYGFSVDNFNNTKFIGIVILSNITLTGVHKNIDVWPIVNVNVSTIVSSNGSVVDYVTTSQLFYASNNNCSINLNYPLNTPRRYGAVGDLITDDTAALQCLLDVMSYEVGDADLRRKQNSNVKGFLISSPIRIISTLIPPGYPARKRLKSIISDNFIENDDFINTPVIKAINIPAKRGALEIIGGCNAIEESTDLNYLYIDASDNSNSDYSFAFLCANNKFNNFVKCNFRGKNAVLSIEGLSSYTVGASYSKICVKWDSCRFIPTKTGGGYALSKGFAFGEGGQVADNELFVNCEFCGLTEIAHNLAKFDNCMWYNDPKNTATTIGDIGFVTDSTKTALPVDYSTDVAIMKAGASTIFENCYFEDHKTCIDVIGDFDASGQGMDLLSIGNLTLIGCYFNGKTNRYDDNHNRIMADYGIRIRKGLSNLGNNITLIDCTFRDGTTTSESDGARMRYFFNYGSIVNESPMFRVKCIGNQFTRLHGFSKADSETYRFFGNIDFEEYTIPYNKEITISNDNNHLYAITPLYTMCYKRVRIEIDNVIESDFPTNEAFQLIERTRKFISKSTSDDIDIILNTEEEVRFINFDSRFMTFDTVNNIGIFDNVIIADRKTNNMNDLNGIKFCAESGKQYQLDFYTSNKALNGKTLRFYIW